MSRARLLLATLLVLLACGPPTAAEHAGDGDGTCATAPSCEEAIVTAELPDVERLVATYAALVEEPGWNALLAAMREPGPLLVHDDGVAAPPLRGVALPGKPVRVGVDRLLLALGRAATRPHLFVQSEGSLRQLFPSDGLEPFTAGLDPVLAAEPQAVEADILLAKTVREAITAAKASDYLRAAAAADELRQQVRGEASLEARWRGRVALVELASAALALEEDEALAPLPPPSAQGSSPYAALLVVLLTTENPSEAFAARRERIASGLEAARAEALSITYPPSAACPKPIVPPMERLGDLFFASQLSAALDPEAGPGDKAAFGKLSLDAWLPRYDAMVRLVADAGYGWSHLGRLLAERGELHGLSPAGSASYERVSALGRAHLAALEKLADAQPTRFSVGGALDLAYRPGLLRDLGLRDAVAGLFRKTVFAKIEGAADEGSLLEAAATAFAAGTSFPGPLQGAQLNALSVALDKKLAGTFGKRRGWPMAGLHAGHALFAMLLGGEGWLDRGATRISASLDGDLAEPSLAKLVEALASYAALAGRGELDPAVQNPRLFPPARAKARESLRLALEGLADGGPTSPPERELVAMVTDFGDAMVALGAAKLSGPGEQTVCRDGDDPLEDALERAAKKRRSLLAHPAIRHGDGAWVQRARLVALVLSDLLDVIDPGESLSLSHAEAAEIVDSALTGWLDDQVADLAGGGYFLVRAALDPHENEAVAREAVRVLTGLANLFGEDAGSLFAVLARVGAEVDVKQAGGDVARLLARYADRAYAADAVDQGDLFLMIALGAAIARENPVPKEAVEVARKHHRPVLLPLTMYDERVHAGADPKGLVEAMQAAVKGECRAPDPSLVIAVRKAIYQFREGDRPTALAALEQVLHDAERDGLVVPRQVFQYQQIAGEKIFNAQQSISLGSHLLEGAGTFQVGLGYQSKAENRGKMYVSFASPESLEAKKESARYYAHAAVLASTYAFALGEDARARAAARRAIDTWATGARLGESRVPVAGETTVWAHDASATLAIAAQQASEAGHALLAGDLWTLVLASLEPTTSDEEVTAILDPLPVHLRGIAEIEAIAPRARESLELVAAKLPCTKKKGNPEDHVSVRCERYPLSLALRIADVLTTMPRLERGAAVGKPACAAWKELDSFLEAVAAQRYEPEAFTNTVATLRKLGHPSDAAMLLARQRHPQHCGAAVVTPARELARDETLGAHLRADLLSIAANCDSASPAVLEDLKVLDALTQRHALPVRNLELLVFATSLALSDDRWEPLYALSTAPDFVKRWQQIGPDLGTAALLIAHAAAVGRGLPVDAEATLPHYRLLCTTFADKKRGSMCSSIALLRDEGQSERKVIAKKALEEFAEHAIESLRPPAAGAP